MEIYYWNNHIKFNIIIFYNLCLAVVQWLFNILSAVIIYSHHPWRAIPVSNVLMKIYYVINNYIQFSSNYCYITNDYRTFFPSALKLL